MRAMSDMVNGMEKISEIRQSLRRKRTEREQSRPLKWLFVIEIIAIAAIAVMTMSALMGCASVPQPTQTTIQQVVVGPAGFSGTIRVAIAGGDVPCTSVQGVIRKQVEEIFSANRVPKPTTSEVVVRTGSSLCSDAQGTANEVQMLDLGGRNVAEAEVSLGWQQIPRDSLRRAEQLLAMMKPR